MRSVAILTTGLRTSEIMSAAFQLDLSRYAALLERMEPIRMEGEERNGAATVLEQRDREWGTLLGDFFDLPRQLPVYTLTLARVGLKLRLVGGICVRCRRNISDR